MKTIRIINRILSGLIIVTVFFFLVGITYSYFTSGLTGKEDTTTITMEAGYFEIVYNGGPDITAVAIYPSVEPFTSKNFTVTANNTTPLEMAYKLSIVIVENTFSNNAISFTLTSNNVTGNGETVTSMANRVSLSQGTKRIGYGKFVGKVNNAVHSYKMDFYFYETNLNQSQDMRKTFKAYIKIEEYDFIGNPEDNLGTKILAQDGGPAAIEAKGNPNFAQVATVADSGLFASPDEYGTSYYYRGVGNNLNNNLIFGGFQWKIIRINGDGTIRILYNGTEEEFNQSGTMNILGINTQINGSAYAWNTININDAKYVGYMYGGANGVESPSRAAAVLNQTNSNAKSQLDLWYQENILGTPIESYVADNIFCNDRQLQSEVGGYPTGLGYGKNTTFYAAYYRLDTNKTPTLKCGLKNDRFTVSDTTVGNGTLTYPIGLITLDELSMGGMVVGTSNPTNYLNTGQGYWTTSPCALNSTTEASVWYVNSAGDLNIAYLTSPLGLRAVLLLVPDITVTGEGTATNPYRVIK